MKKLFIIILVILNTSFSEPVDKLYLCQAVVMYHNINKEVYFSKVVRSKDSYKCRTLFINWLSTKKDADGYIPSGKYIIQELRDDNILK